MSYASEVLADSPAVYYRMDETSGQPQDSSGNARHTTATAGTPDYSLVGSISSDPTSTAIGFNGSTEYFDRSYLAALNPSPFSVEAWAYPTGGQGTFRSPVTSRSTGNLGYVLYAADDNTWQFWAYNGASAVVVGGGTVTLNAWTHLVGTVDATTISLYINAGTPITNSVTLAVNATRPLRIGAGATEDPADFFFPGRVDEVAVYPTALSAARVSAHYAASFGGLAWIRA